MRSDMAQGVTQIADAYPASHFLWKCHILAQNWNPNEYANGNSFQSIYVDDTNTSPIIAYSPSLVFGWKSRLLCEIIVPQLENEHLVPSRSTRNPFLLRLKDRSKKRCNVHQFWPLRASEIADTLRGTHCGNHRWNCENHRESMLPSVTPHIKKHPFFIGN